MNQLRKYAQQVDGNESKLQRHNKSSAFHTGVSDLHWEVNKASSDMNRDPSGNRRISLDTNLLGKNDRAFSFSLICTFSLYGKHNLKALNVDHEGEYKQSGTCSFIFSPITSKSIFSCQRDRRSVLNNLLTIRLKRLKPAAAHIEESNETKMERQKSV